MSKKKILLVEDDEMTLEVLSAALIRLGYDVFSSKNGDEAKQEIINHSPDLILSDIFMPEFSGLQLLNFIQKKSRHKIPVILISSMDEGKMSEMVGDAGAVGFLSKPIDIKELEAKLAKALQE